MTSFTKKKIDVTLQLANNKTFNDMGDNTLNLQGLRVEANIKNVGAIGTGNSASFKIYGMSQDDMNKISVIKLGLQQLPINYIQVSAGDADNMTKVFDGVITSAWADYSSIPDVPLVIQARISYDKQMKPADPTSWDGEFNVGDGMALLAAKMGYSFTNVNVEQKHPSMTLKGTLLEQAKTLANSAGIFMMIEHNHLMTIATKGTPLTRDIPLITPETGMIGYPSFNENGLSVTTLFNPEIKMANNVEINCPLELANGKWYVRQISYMLESEKQNGAWFSQVELTPVKISPTANQTNEQNATSTDENPSTTNTVSQ